MELNENMDKRYWYLVYTKPRQEELARDNLTRQGYEIYLPMIVNRRRRNGRYRNVVEPMFSRYLLIHLNTLTDNWGPIRSTVGAINVVRIGTEPARIPEEVVEKLQAREAGDSMQNTASEIFKKGEAIRICDGPMAGCEGLYMAGTGQERAIVLLEIAGRYARLSLSESQIEVA